MQLLKIVNSRVPDTLFLEVAYIKFEMNQVLQLRTLICGKLDIRQMVKC